MALSSAGLGVCLSLEDIVSIRPAAPDDLHDTRREVERKEKHAPALVLPYVDVLMSTNARQDGMVDANDQVTKRNRDKAGRGGKRSQYRRQAAARNFDCAVDATKSCAGAHGDRGERRAQCGRRGGPKIAQQAAEPVHVSCEGPPRATDPPPGGSERSERGGLILADSAMEGHIDELARAPKAYRHRTKTPCRTASHRAKLIGKTSCPVVDLAPRVQRGLSLDQHDLALLFGHRIVTNAFGNAS
jgi:hypothetical protein